MPVEVLMPKLGLTMQEGRIVEWKKMEGDFVEKGEILYVLETEKIVFEVEAPATGRLGKILIPEGETAPIGVVVGYLLLEGEDGSSIPATAEIELARVPAGEEGRAGEAATGGEEEERSKISPVARKMAAEKGIDPRKIRGTGPGGRIVKEDVLRFIEEREAQTKAAMAKQLEKPELFTAKESSAVPDAEIIKPGMMRRTIARRMSESFQSAPHIYLTVEVDAGELLKLREDLLPYIQKECGQRLSVTDLLVKILSKVLTECPFANATWSEERIKVYKKINVGIATALEDGLIVPVLTGVEQMSLTQIVSLRVSLTERARERKLTPEELTGGTFTFSNLGMYGVDFFSAIINPPESAILAAGRIKEKPVVQKGEIVVRPMMCLTLSADHRVLDGAYAARFLQRLKEIIEKPILAFQ